jgi:hypothetical protein
MPPPYTVLNARVKQKLATEAYWLSIEDELGVIFEGEQAFVYNDEGVPVNFKIGDGTKLFSELPYFIAYYSNVINCKTLFYLAQSANITTPGVFRNNSEIDKIIFINNSGSDVLLKVGTTDGGTEIADLSLPNGVNTISIDYFFTGAQTIYFTGLTGVDFSMIVLYFQLDEAPVTAPSSTPSTGGGLKYGTVYEFFPAYDGHAEAVWDFITGYGKSGSGYEDAMLWGTNGLPELPNYHKGYVDGDTIGGEVGANSVALVTANLPPIPFSLGLDRKGGNSGLNVVSAINPGPYGQNLYALGGTSVPIDKKPLSNIVLRYTGIPTTT